MVLKCIRERLQCEIGEHIAVICEVFGLNLLKGGANNFLSRFKGGGEEIFNITLRGGEEIFYPA